MRMYHFSVQNGPFAPIKFFFGKLLIPFSPTYYPIHCAKFKKNSSSGSRVMRMRNFSENVLMDLGSSIHAYLRAKNQCQILIY